MLGRGEELGHGLPGRPAALSWPVELALSSHMPIYSLERRIPIRWHKEEDLR